MKLNKEWLLVGALIAVVLGAGSVIGFTDTYVSQVDNKEMFDELLADTPSEYLAFAKHIRVYQHAPEYFVLGQTDLNSKTVYLYADRINSYEEAKQTLYHELAHLMIIEWGYGGLGYDEREELTSFVGDLLYQFEVKA